MTNSIKILAVGGGSGGHIVPVKAVIDELLQKNHQLRVEFWCDRNSLKMAKAVFGDGCQVKISTIVAGKFRRYHHFKWWQHLRPSILIPNIIDFFKFGFGFIQSLVRLSILRPDLVFIKGGFVCLPVGLAAHILGIKIITHDSDTVAGLTNRLLAKYAVKITTGMPIEYYNYPPQKTSYVGIPTVNDDSDGLISAEELGLPKAKKIILVSGGGLGSELLNKLVIESLSVLDQEIFVVLVAGKIGFERLRQQELSKDQIKVLEFVPNFYQYMSVADAVVARAGATTLAELANAGKAVILVPNRKLVGGHQLKNAQILADAKAAIVLDEIALEKQKMLFANTINELVKDKPLQGQLRDNIKKLARPNAAKDLADIILAEVENA